MRKPQTWDDKGLLEDEPFFSAFKARRIAPPPTSNDSNASRNATISKEIEDRKLLGIVQAWADLAFEPNRDDLQKRKVNAKEPGISKLFVQFYWILSQDYHHAAGILQHERKRRGYGSVLGIPRQRGASTSLTKLKKVDTKPKPILENKADHDALRGQSPSKIVTARKIPTGLRFKKNGDVSGCPEQGAKTLSQSCPSPLQLASGLSEPQDRQIKLNSHTSSDSQNVLPTTRKRRQTSPDTRHVKHRQINGATSKLCDVSDASISLQLANTSTQPDNQVTNLGATDNLKSRFQAPSRPEESSPSYPPASVILPPNAPVSHIYGRQRGLEAHPAQGGSIPLSRPKDANPGVRHMSNDAISGQPYDKRTEHRSRINGSRINLDSRKYPRKIGTKTDNLPEGRGTSTSRIQVPRSALQSFSDQCDASPICDRPNSRKRHSSSLGEENHAVVLKEVSNGSLKQATTTGHRETKRRKIIQMDGPVNNKPTVPAVQKDLIPISAQLFPVKWKRRRSPKVKQFEQEGSASITIQPKGKGRHPKSKVPSLAQAQSNVGMADPLSEQNVEIKQDPSSSTYSLAQLHGVLNLQKTVEEPRRHDHTHWPMLDCGMDEELINNWPFVQEDKEPLNLDCEAPAATQMEGHSTDHLPTYKPPLGVKPPIWAQSRQEVCETFDWFRSYQGGVYFTHNMVKGYLLSAFSSKRDRFEHGGRLIISHGGGKAESLHTRKGQTTAQPATDQLAQDKSVRALLDNYRNQRPLVLLIDDKYVLFPYDLGARDITYVVLGFYTIAHAWAEYQPANNEAGCVVRYKFAFRWCDDQGSPWWLTDKETNSSEPDLTPPSIPSISPYIPSVPSSIPTTFSLKPTSKRKPAKTNKNALTAPHTSMVREVASSGPKSSLCESCHMGSPQVYSWSWLCLHPHCSKFWRDTKGNYPPENLQYDFDFLKLMTSLPIPPGFGKLKPDPPSRLSADGVVTSYAFTRGFHCNVCGRLSCRFKWEKWECSNCKECFQISRVPYKAKDFWSNLLSIGYKDHFIRQFSDIKQQPVRIFRHENGMGNIQSFILPDGRGKIHHIQPGTPAGRIEADKIFLEYQEQATAGILKFRRWPLRTHKCRGALLTNYFSQNSGEPYQYVGGAANTVPFENAPGAVVKARALIQKRIQQALEMRVEFNEVLSAAYMERQKMAFHSDNEIGLGPVVAGLSLGSPALMHFRILAKHDPLREQKGNLMSFVLRHGDVLVMDGAGVQEYYEHTVVPNNFRIAATARQISPEHA